MCKKVNYLKKEIKKGIVKIKLNKFHIKIRKEKIRKKYKKMRRGKTFISYSEYLEKRLLKFRSIQIVNC